MGGFIFDLDQTLVDSSVAEMHRQARDWSKVYELIPEFHIYDGMLELLNKIVAKGYALSIVTASPSTYCQRVIEHFRLPFTVAVCYHDTQKRKPHPEPILLACERMAISPSKVISIGDRDIDIVASRSANVFSIGALWGSSISDRQKLIESKPNLIFTSPAELMDFLVLKGKI
ncbi:HAD family hydrolase [Taibaiella soli]|uniref:HAD family hydrolase n=1 Tax=Taibaiella soli TaxID=1649169 RepID=A0A2W2AK35_9BACT|nr:HAD family hydrolase [Taibaiella soli]PZF72610.1 hypothetical protein DN068_12145 [Taibaiella soli]